ncbi:MAG: hypothetical protein ACE5LU_26245, partial [Anaerolineae bacterium]
EFLEAGNSLQTEQVFLTDGKTCPEPVEGNTDKNRESQVLSVFLVHDTALADEITDDIIDDPDEYRKVNAFLLPGEATWDYIRRNARADDIKIRLDRAMERLEEMHPQLRRVLSEIYAAMLRATSLPNASARPTSPGVPEIASWLSMA